MPLLDVHVVMTAGTQLFRGNPPLAPDAKQNVRLVLFHISPR